jgi:hypothetical protein
MEACQRRLFGNICAVPGRVRAYDHAMKARFYPVVLSLALGLLAPISCRAADAADSPHFSFVDPDDPALAAIRLVGVRTIDQSGNALLGEVKRVLTTTSPALAVGMFHLKDYKLPLPARGEPVVTALRRTSLRLRNSSNIPDEADLAALAKIQSELEAGDSVSPLLMQRVIHPDQPVEWRVYRPMVVMKQCLSCHGPDQALAPGVIESLQVFFPRDNAAGYKSGEWRGLIRVSITEVPKKP